MSLFTDLHIRNGDVVLDAGNNPTYLTDREVIAQDIVHAILETGLAHLLIGQRNQGELADVKTRIKLLVEDDVRIMPGTVQISEPSLGEWWVSADTINFGSISSRLITGVNN